MIKDFTKWFILVLLLIITSGVIITILNYVGIIGGTVVERVVFESSYQYTAGQKAKINLFEAQLAEIDRKLSSPDLNDNTRSNLDSQASSIRIQLSVAKRSQK